MVDVEFTFLFERTLKKIKNVSIKTRLKKQIKKVIKNPKIGKPMMYGRKNTRELYIKPYRLSYLYLEKENKIVFLDLYHKDKQ